MNQKIHLLVVLDPRTDGELNMEILGRKYLELAGLVYISYFVATSQNHLMDDVIIKGRIKKLQVLDSNAHTA